MSFKDILGQDRILRILGSVLTQGRVGHAYLFAGPDGVGKGLTAMTFAKALNCTQEPADACGTCVSCRKIERSIHPDISHIAVKGFQKIKIAQIRELQGRAALTRYEGRTKVFVVEGADNFTEEAANAFLKTLEEPPAHAVIILTAENLERVLPTIQSRCHIMRFSRLAAEVIADLLVRKRGVEKKNAEFIAKLSRGSIGRAVAFIDGDRLRLREQVMLDFLKQAYAVPEECFAWLYDAPKDVVCEVLDIMEGLYRDLVVSRIGCPETALFNAQHSDEITLLSRTYSVDRLFEEIENIQRYKSYAQRNVNTKLLVDGLIP